MEALTTLKHWGGSGGGAAPPGAAAVKTLPTTTVASAVLGPSAETDDDGEDFFDLEFTVPDEGEEEGGGENDDSSDDESDDVREFDFTMSSERSQGCHRSDPNACLSPSDELFFKGRLLPLAYATSEPSSKPQLSTSFLKSATRFRILMLRFKKSKSTAPEPKGTPATITGATAVASPEKQQSKLSVKLKVEEVPIKSLFARDNSSRRCSSSGRATKLNTVEGLAPGSEEKRNSKDVVHRYLSKIKPLYVRVSKRYGEKLGFSGQLSSQSGKVEPTEGVKSGGEVGPAAINSSKGSKPPAGNIPSGLRVVCRRLGKSRSASSAIAAVQPPPLPRRRDDSLLQQQDGIQSAIAHCKRSFHAAEGSDVPLMRSNSDPGEARLEKVDL